MYAELDTVTAKLEWLQDLSRDLQDAVGTKERAIADLESEVDDLRAVETALATVPHRLKLRLGIEPVEGQLPLPPTATKTWLEPSTHHHSPFPFNPQTERVSAQIPPHSKALVFATLTLTEGIPDYES